MILIDSLYINNGGGKVLLDYLIESLESQEFEVFYLLDIRIYNSHPKIKSNNKVVYINPSIVERHKFYKSHLHSFKKILCFGNLPPTIRTSAIVYTYFHQKLFLEITHQISLKQKIVFKLKSAIFKYLQSNTNYWLVQTQVMEDSLCKKLNKNNSNVLKMPFYPPLIYEEFIVKESNTFLYVSSGSEHKNHKILLEAFKIFYDYFSIGKLHITVGREFIKLHQFINDLILAGYPIINHEFVERSKLAHLYKSCTYAIYPSLSESFGLGIIEAIENECDIIGADLPYTYAVCKPSLVFDPTNIESIAAVFQLAVENEVPHTEQLVFNEIDKLMELLN